MANIGYIRVSTVHQNEARQKEARQKEALKKYNLDTNSPTGKLMLTNIASINEFLRTINLENQLEGIEIAKKEGKYKGRKAIKKPSNWNEIFALYLQKELPATEAMKKLELKKDIFYKFARADYKNYLSTRILGIQTQKISKPMRERPRCV